MGLWSSIKNAAKKVWQKTKAVARTISRVIVELVGRVLGIVDLLLGFAAWPPKKLRLHVVILSQDVPPPPVITISTTTDVTIKTLTPIVNPTDLTASIDFARQHLKDKFNIKLLPYSSEFVQVDNSIAPSEALNVSCGSGALGNEYGTAGEFFAKRLAGWNVIPISLVFPITVFVVSNVIDKQGCSLGPLSDYITIDPDGIASQTTLMHEIGHSCGLWHSQSQSNIMYSNSSRGSGVKWFQKNLLRSSRHVMYW